MSVSVLHPERCHLGEGPTYDRKSDTAWWFDILGKVLFEHRFASGETRRHELPFMGSQLSYVDDGRQLIAADEGLFLRDIASGGFELVAPMESDDAGTRSNDGRTHPAGALWIGTMGRKAEDGAGAIYYYRKGELKRLFGSISIPNAICFSPDGRTGYFCDTRVNRLMCVPLSPDTGLPEGEPTVLHDAAGEEAGLDGAVVDADGVVWVARWGGSRVDAIGPDGRKLREIAIPAFQASCPAFVGPGLDRMIVTSAWEGMDEGRKAVDSSGGMTFVVDMPMRGREDPRVVV